MAPQQPKIYHIIHADRLGSVVADGHLWCDAHMVEQEVMGTTIGMPHIKARRLNNRLTSYSYPDIRVGECVPFYFCPRSVMLYLIYMGNHPDLNYRGGQEPIIHLEADLRNVVDWADRVGHRWAFTTSNAASTYFEDRCDLGAIDEIDWSAVEARNWTQCREFKQAEFLIEQSFPWELVERIGIHPRTNYQVVANALPVGGHRPPIEILADWYY